MPSIVDQRHCSLLNPGRHSRFGGCWGKLVPGALSLPQPVKRQVNGTSHAWIVEWLLAGIDNHLVRAHGDTPGRNCAAGHARFGAATALHLKPMSGNTLPTRVQLRRHGDNQRSERSQVSAIRRTWLVVA